MKNKITLLITVLFLGLNLSFAQSQEECLTKLSIMSEYAKAKDYEAAYKPFMELREECPRYNKAIYTYGEKILKHKIKNSNGAEKIAFINDLIKMWGQRAANFASKTPKGEYEAKKAQLRYDNRKDLGLTDVQLFDAFDKPFNDDRKSFKNAKSLYIYFKLMVKLYDAKQKTAQQLFDKYDDIVEKIEVEVKDNSDKLNVILAKEEAGTALVKRERQFKKYHTQSLAAFDKISGSVDKELGDRANCDNLIPLYQKDFEANKSNEIWLRRAAGKMSDKDCTGDPLFFKLVNALHTLNPSASSAYYLGILKDKEGASNEALKYYEQSLSLQQDPFKKAKLYKKIAIKFKAKGNFGKARTYFQKALELNPSDKSPHSFIAAMYASSAKNCGDSSFNKRAVYWLAEREAKKAGNTKAIARYKALAPAKSDIFTEGNAGTTIKIGCWIGRSVTVPSI
jgi:tetratricopeptide (TPR) repeat protein